MPATHQRGEPRQIMLTIASSKAINQGELVALSSGTVVKASDETWVTDKATTRRNFVAKFAGVSAQEKAANANVFGNSDSEKLKIRTDCSGVYRFAVGSGTYALGDLVGPAKDGSSNVLVDSTLEKVTTIEEAIGKVVEGAGTNPGYVLVEIFSRVFPVQQFGIASISFAGLTLLAAAGRNGAGAITLTGATVGQRVIAVIANPTAGGVIAAPAAGTFESVITVADQVQQVSASNLSSNTYIFWLAPAPL